MRVSGVAALPILEKGPENMKTVSILVLTGVLFSSSLQAHHSVAAYLDDQPVRIEGTIKEVLMVNPHTRFIVETTTENGETVDYQFETAGPGVLRGRGWTNETLQAGQEVIAVGSPHRSRPTDVTLTRFELPNGMWLDQGGIREPDTAAATGGRGGAAAGRGGRGGAAAQGGRGPPEAAGEALGVWPEEPAPSGASRELLSGTWSSVARSLLHTGRDPEALSIMTELGREMYESFDINSENTASCTTVGTPRMARGTIYSTQIVDTGDIIYMISEYNAQTRRIHMAGQQPPSSFFPNRFGWSTGSWEDGRLTIHTDGLTPERINATSGDYFGGGEDAYMVERYYLSEDGNMLSVHTSYYDPAHYTEPYDTFFAYARAPEELSYALDCVPTHYE